MLWKVAARSEASRTGGLDFIMRLETSMSQRMSMDMRLAPRMIQSMEILQMPVLALQERIDQELQENPVLELVREQDGESIDRDTLQDLRRDDDAGILKMDPVGGEADFRRLDDMTRDYGDAIDTESWLSRGARDDLADKHHDLMQNAPDRGPTLLDHLLEQIPFVDAPPETLALVRYWAEAVDDNGYLPTDMTTLAESHDPAVTVDELEDALDCLQRFDPAGVGGRDLKEVLLLQVTRQTPRAELVRQLINNHLEDIQHNRLPAIQRRTGRELTDIREAIESLKHLNPKPGSAFTGEKAMALIPDVIIELQEDGNYSVRLKDDMIPNLRVNSDYENMAKNKQTDPTTRDYLKRKVNAANWLQDAIEQRKYTLERVTRAIVERQKKFLDMGPEFIEPLKMQQIADDVGVHVTTISRAVDDKYAQTPRGIFPLKRFFGGGTTTSSGEELAWEIIKRKLTELVASEDKSNPLSDEDLVERMGQSGVPIARRTITKYRKMLNIPSSRERREW